MLTKKQLAEYLQVTTTTIDRMISRGIPRYKTSNNNGAIRFDIEEVKEWLKKNSN